MLYEQQRSAGSTLASLESQVKTARMKFTELVIRQRYWESQENIDNLFNRGSNKEVSSTLTKLKDSNNQS